MPQPRPQKAVTELEMAILKKKIVDQVIENPQKAAIILTEWIKKTPKSFKKAG